MIAIGEALPVATPLGGREFSRWPRRIRTLGYILVVLSLASSFATFALLMGLTPIDPTGEVVVSAMAVNGALVGVLALAVGWEIVTLVRARRKGRAAARLHIRVVALFSIIAAVPAILVALAASFTLNRGLDHWFSERTRQIVSTSQQIALAFAEEQARSLRTDILTLRLDFERAQPLLEADPDQFQTFMNSVAAFRGIPGLYLVKPDGSMIAQADFQFKLAFVPPPPEALDQAKAGSDPVLIAPGATRIVGALIRLQSYRDVLLYVSREIDPKVVRYINMTTDNINEYRSMEQTRFAVQVAFGLLYLGISLVVLLSAIWLGIGFANRIVSPIRRLIDASDQVARGNLAVEVPYRSADGDIGALGQTFNTMTAELRRQQAELVAANGLIDSRRRFTEAVLAGVSAGVVGVDADGKVTLANRGGLRFLGVADESGAIGRPIAELVPELTDVVAVALVDQGRTEHRDQIALVRDGRERTLNVRVTTERSESDAHGYVVTLDDITDLMTAQRGAAWADIARRIAHEIKNPLTPIQLSAERLRRRFGKTVGEGREVFDQCVDTIIRQVGDIGRMVDEFSAFARMPKPAMEARDLRDPVREAVFLLEVGHPDIEFRIDLPAQPMVGRFDTRLVSQVFTNVVKNATEAIAALPPEARGTPRITVAGRVEGDQIVVDVIDTGIGLPAENRQRLLEPYMTTREKGTGLGLAIVRKILEEHGGRIDLLDAPQVAEGGHGAMVRITLPKSEAPLPEPAREAAA